MYPNQAIRYAECFHPIAPVVPRTTWPALKRYISHNLHMCQTEDAPLSQPPSSSRRALLVASGMVALSTLLPQVAGAYSSPYRPGQGKELPLPQRLYDTPPDAIIRTQSGLRYFDLALGQGSEAHDGDTVFVNYTSRLAGLNGIKIQSSYDDPSAPPFIFRLGAPDVVPGVSEAVRGMRVGGKRRALLPSDISYKSPDMKPAVTEFFARRRLLSVLETNRDATIAFE